MNRNTFSVDKMFVYLEHMIRNVRLWEGHGLVWVEMVSTYKVKWLLLDL